MSATQYGSKNPSFAFVATLLMALLSFRGPAAAAENGDTTFPVTASSVFGAPNLPEFAFDDNPQTRWATEYNVPEAWLQVDLAENTRIKDLTIRWEAAYAADYEVLVSADGAKWTSIHHQKAGTGGEEHLSGLSGKGRYLRIACHRPGPFPLYSIWEVSSGDKKLAAAFSGVRDGVKAAREEAARAARERLRHSLDEAGIAEMVFATRPLHPDGHWYANISYFAQDTNTKTYAKGGGLYKLNAASSTVTPLVEDAEGTLRDPAVHYDGRTIVFSWRKGGTDSFHLFTIDADGSGLKQLTSGEYDDIEPAWLPDGGIAFVSSRCRRWVNCWLTQVAIVHRCNADGTGIEPISANLEQDNTPWPMNDGRILYTRWEYVDRSQVDYHHLWAMNPDGTGQMTHFGNMHPGGVFIDAKPVPGTDEVLFINSPGHGAKEHAGMVALVNVKKGPDELPAIHNLTDAGYRDPYPITSDAFLAARGRDIMLLDRMGTTERLYTLPGSAEKLELHEPRPLVPHPREPVIPPRADRTKTTGKLILADVRAGRNMGGVAPGEVRKLLVVESLPKPINYTGGMDPLSYGGSFTLERVLGTVPVEADGSACFEVPADRALFFVALDGNDNSVKRMQSFLTVMPGETMGCVGCHEPRTTAVSNPKRAQLKALDRPASTIEPIAGIPEVFDFPRDIQPILDRRCVSCHDYTPHKGAAFGPRAGGVILNGDHGPMFSQSYATLTARHQIADGRDLAKSNLPPRTIGASASPLMKKIDGQHHGVTLSAKETALIRYWIETGATYPGTYAALGSGCVGGYAENKLTGNDTEWPETTAAADVIGTRCAACHSDTKSLPSTLSDENGLSFWRPDDWNDLRLLRSRHLVFNLTRPELSMILLAPLSEKAGGYGICRYKDPAGNDMPFFQGKDDPDYQKLLALCTAGQRQLDQIKRFDMPGFRPPAPYVREMKRYKVLPENFEPGQPLDFYATDRAYWQSFEAPKTLEHPAYAAGPASDPPSSPQGKNVNGREVTEGSLR